MFAVNEHQKKPEEWSVGWKQKERRRFKRRDASAAFSSLPPPEVPSNAEQLFANALRLLLIKSRTWEEGVKQHLLLLFINFLLSLHLPSFLSSVSGVVNLRRASCFLSSSSWWQRWAINSSKSSRVFQLAAVWEDTHTHGDDCDECVIGAFYHH